MKKLLVVCMGNICRSPTGEAVLRAKAKELGISVEVDSAGTIGYHAGNPPDARSMQAGKQRGYSFKGMRSRKVTIGDFDEFDMVLAADKANLADLLDICPTEHRHKVSLFLSHGDSDYDEIPDPYYGGDAGFELVLDLIEDASEVILKKL
ncbi:MAG: low molecular weight protein-tyrosine-phosphatase [Pseudomonadota bacterium]|jgi:protein-tyrosine phosphatase|uniref:low molecular weight protein-tyrosine-phosphatase n=1 Tax=Vibrio TaxID=662 RepID=UPI000971AABB|nr:MULTISPECIES: low molecular weight protein-tyrosine-phosphatase [Vibrio]APX05659.1 protein-tyrosine-phosphatase [Vibrio campbellii]ARR05845.1 protein tyrosine phosphatase [Vibrio campbellii]AYO09869.1 low molecular weight phosphotyrosine protein phosphatase [Vibrio campbellii]MCC4223860.1 low molecular weight phosphotyrosine protein phosphatase [Vibrio campbellii]MCC8256406.1 low molecular weight phosphotyrosine protein phosphatase [Vibrio campbellii CAIM 333]|tara:strand:+ start:1160 stop:1609 length:450 start_codon:yes stop_codon:yes gene_type:complete